MKIYPYLRGGSKPDWPQIPWDMITPHEDQAQRNHSQTLKRLAERGGLCPEEMLAVLEDRDYRDRVTDDQAVSELRVLLATWQATR